MTEERAEHFEAGKRVASALNGLGYAGLTPAGPDVTREANLTTVKAGRVNGQKPEFVIVLIERHATLGIQASVRTSLGGDHVATVTKSGDALLPLEEKRHPSNSVRYETGRLLELAQIYHAVHQALQPPA